MSDNQKIYFIDDVVLGMFLEIDDEQKRDQAFVEYTKRINLLAVEEIRAYYLSEGTPEAMEDAADITKLILGDNESTKQIKLPEELRTRLKDLINQLNKFIYSTYGPKLSEDRKTKLNEYLDKTETESKEVLSYVNSILTVSKEIADLEKMKEELSLPQVNNSVARVNLTGVH